LNQRDGIHPNAEGARRVERLVWRAIEPALAQAAAR
jgi:lysophospholipase L1-like esterase